MNSRERYEKYALNRVFPGDSRLIRNTQVNGLSPRGLKAWAEVS